MKPNIYLPLTVLCILAACKTGSSAQFKDTPSNSEEIAGDIQTGATVKISKLKEVERLEQGKYFAYIQGRSWISRQIVNTDKPFCSFEVGSKEDLAQNPASVSVTITGVQLNPGLTTFWIESKTTSGFIACRTKKRLVVDSSSELREILGDDFSFSLPEELNPKDYSLVRKTIEETIKYQRVPDTERFLYRLIGDFIEMDRLQSLDMTGRVYRLDLGFQGPNASTKEDLALNKRHVRASIDYLIKQKKISPFTTDGVSDAFKNGSSLYQIFLDLDPTLSVDVVSSRLKKDISNLQDNPLGYHHIEYLREIEKRLSLVKPTIEKETVVLANITGELNIQRYKEKFIQLKNDEIILREEVEKARKKIEK